MLVVNNGVDVRVMKEANSLKELGYHVRLFGRMNAGDADMISLEGINIERVVPIGNAETLWAYFRRTAMKLSVRQRLRILRVYLTWVIAGYRLGAQMSRDDIDENIFAEHGSRLGRVLRDPLRMLEKLAGDMAVWASKTNPASRKGRLIRKIAALFGDPATLYIQNEYPIFSLSMYDTALRFNPDIVHSHDLYMLRTGVSLKNQLGCKLVYDAHELERDRVRDYPLWRKKITWNEEKSLINSTNDCITVSEHIADDMAQRYSIKKPTIIFNTSFSGPEIQEECRKRFMSLRQIIGLNDNTPLVVHIGKLFDMYRQTGQFKEMIESLCDLPGVHLAFLGPNHGRAKKQVAEWSRRYFVEERVHVIDPVPYQFVPSFISDSTLGIVAMHGDNLNTEYAMPNKLFEMALAGLPFIVSDQTEIREFVTEQARGLVADCNDPHEICEAIKKIVNNPSDYTYSDEQLQKIRRDFGWPAQKEKLRILYGGLIPAAGTAAPEPDPAADLTHASAEMPEESNAEVQEELASPETVTN